MSTCEECWDEAFFRSRLTGRLQADVYHELRAALGELAKTKENDQ